MALSCFFSEI